MKRSIFLLAVVAVLSCTSCMTQKTIASSPGVELANETESLPVTVKQRNWYILFGLVPLNATNTEKAIKDKNLKKVRATTQITFVDFLLNIPTSIITVYSTTTIVEGQN